MQPPDEMHDEHAVDDVCLGQVIQHARRPLQQVIRGKALTSHDGLSPLQSARFPDCDYMHRWDMHIPTLIWTRHFVKP